MSSRVNAALTGRERSAAAPPGAASLGALALALLLACGGAPPAPLGEVVVAVPSRAATAGDAAWARLPAGADLVLELDLARARDNPVVGDVIAAAIVAFGAAGLEAAAAEATPLADVEVIVLAAYDVGTLDAATITLLRPRAGIDRAAWPAALDVGDGWLALAPPARQSALRDATPRLDDDRGLRALRARAMPAEAEGATLRATARLDDDARVALARLVAMEPAPRGASAWGDLADDAALVIELDGADALVVEPGKQAATALARLLAVASALPVVRDLGLGPALARAQVTVAEPWARLVLVVAPARLQRVATRARLGLGVAVEEQP